MIKLAKKKAGRRDEEWQSEPLRKAAKQGQLWLHS
jgi:hypothetical protein